MKISSIVSDNVVSTFNWSNFGRLSRRAGLSAIAGLSCLDTGQGLTRHVTLLEHAKCHSGGCPRTGTSTWTSSSYLATQHGTRLTLATTQHGNTHRIENIGSTSWKPLNVPAWGMQVIMTMVSIESAKTRGTGLPWDENFIILT